MLSGKELNQQSLLVQVSGIFVSIYSFTQLATIEHRR